MNVFGLYQKTPRYIFFLCDVLNGLSFFWENPGYLSGETVDKQRAMFAENRQVPLQPSVEAFQPEVEVQICWASVERW